MKRGMTPAWAIYESAQSDAKSSRLNDAAWANDETLDSILDVIEEHGADCDGEMLKAKIQHIPCNRQSKFRSRRAIEGKWLTPFQSEESPINLFDQVAARERLIRICRTVAANDWSLLMHIGQGGSYLEAGANIGTMKSKVSRFRKRVAA